MEKLTIFGMNIFSDVCKASFLADKIATESVIFNFKVLSFPMCKVCLHCKKRSTTRYLFQLPRNHNY